MPDTNIDQAANLTSIRLKVPTGTVPIPPAGYGQLHSPAPGELAIRLHDGSVVPVGGGGDADFALGARNLLGPNGQILTDGTEPGVGIDATPVPGLSFRVNGVLEDQEARPYVASGAPGSVFPVERKAVSYAVQPEDTGTIFVATADDVVFTLPVVADGLSFTVIDLNGDADHPCIVRPQIGEQIIYLTRPALAVSKGVIADSGVVGQTAVFVGIAGAGWVLLWNVPDGNWTAET